MREIKFRDWDGERLGKVNTIGWDDEGVEFVNTPRYSGPAEDFRLMQYTGLKDKKGVEIFEGDVYEDGDGKRHVVTFKNGGFGRVGRFLINYHTNESIVTHEPLINDVIDGCEVIGNIYENPELLERESK